MSSVACAFGSGISCCGIEDLGFGACDRVLVATGAMEAVIPAPVPHSGAVILSQPQGKSVVLRSNVGLSLWQSEGVVGFNAYDLRGEFRKRQRMAFLGRDFRVLGRRSQRQRSAMEVRAIDAAQSFDYEFRKSQELEKSSKLKVGIVGFGNFGQFLAERIVKQGHKVLAHSRRDYSKKAGELGVAFFRSVSIAFSVSEYDSCGDFLLL